MYTIIKPTLFRKKWGLQGCPLKGHDSWTAQSAKNVIQWGVAVSDMRSLYSGHVGGGGARGRGKLLFDVCIHVYK